MTDRSQLSDYFARPWRNEAEAAGSPLYVALCDVVSTDSWLLDLAAEAQAGQPAPNMLFAAVHAVVVKHREDPLAAYYHSAGGTKSPDASLGPIFRDFCARYRDAIAHFLHTGLTQTNEVRRCACLLPAFTFAWREGGERPLAIVEVGPSAGLNLLFDRYAYDYRPLFHAGVDGSGVVVDADVRGALVEDDVTMPIVATRIGIDLNPLDVRVDENAEWLQALTWPEHDDRRELLAAAIAAARDAGVTLLRGDAIELLPGVLAGLPPDINPIVLATFVLNQLSLEQRAAFRRVIEDASRTRPITLIVMGFSDFLGWEGLQPDGSTFVKVAIADAGVIRYRTLLHCHPHGRWLEYLRDGDWVTVEP